MFKKYFKTRIDIINAVIFFIILLLIFRLADLQIVKGDYYRKRSETLRTRNINVSAPRGSIVDKYGRILAGNKQSYSVNMMKTDIPLKNINEVALSLINIIEKNGDTYKDEIPIKINPIRFKFDDYELDWKLKNNIPAEATAKQAFEKLKEDFSIPADMVDLEAYDTLKTDYNLELPFSIDDMQFTYAKDEAKWKKTNGFAENATAKEVFDGLLKKYEIVNTTYTDDAAKKILAVKYLLNQNKFKAYEPVEIAINVSEKTRAQIEENKIFLTGVDISNRPLRIYKNGELASHIIGYMGRIGDEIDQLIDKGYKPQDMIGKSGIENSMEQYLKGVDGTKQIEVDVSGALINTIDEQDPTPGGTVFLTIDSKVQKAAEDSLKKTLQQIRTGDESQGFKSYPNAIAGAVVALDVNTGKVLAMASEPKFDPNLFIDGISSEDWKTLQPQTKELYSPKPLINNAISSPLPPGSTMKLVAAVAGLENNKITPSEIIVDKGLYTAIPGVTPSCSIWKSNHIAHGAQTVALALKNSCNYFFFEVGRRIGGETFEEYANRLGFGQYTGIELPYEYKGNIEGPAHKTLLYERYLKNYLVNGLKMTDENKINEVMGYIKVNPGKAQVKKRLKELGITESRQIEKIQRYINDSKWQPGNVLNAAIGQGLDNATPLQMANYLASIVNGGTRYKPYLVEKVLSYDGKTVLEKKPEVVDKIQISNTTLEAIKKGMHMVTNEAGGTAVRAFIGCKVVISGKTGTAQAGKYRPDPKNKPDYYVNYDDHAWFIAFAPYDKPQIAVAISIFQGGHGNYAAPIARAVIEQYLLHEDTNDFMPVVNDIIP